MDPQTRAQLENLAALRERLAEVDMVCEPDVAAGLQVSLRADIRRVEDALHARVGKLSHEIRESVDLRACYSERMDREAILQVLSEGRDVEEPERDTPKLRDLIQGEWIFTESKPIKFDLDKDSHRLVSSRDPITVAEDAQKDFSSSLEDLLFAGHDKGLKAWIDSLTPIQLAVVRVMMPRLHQMVEGAYTKLPHMEYPEIISKPQSVSKTQHLADLEKGSFDD